MIPSWKRRILVVASAAALLPACTAGRMAVTTKPDVVSVVHAQAHEAAAAVRHADVYAATAPDDFSPAVAGIPRRVYVPDSKGTTVAVIDPATLRIVGRINAGTRLQHVAPAWDLTRLYAESEYTSALTIIDPRRVRTVGTIRGVTEPYNLYFTPDGSTAIVVAEAHRLLQFRNPRTFGLLGSVSIPSPGVDHLDFTADGRYLLASTEYAGALYKVDVATMRVAAVLLVGGRPIDVRLSPDGSVFYVANQGRNGVSVIDPASMRELAFLRTGNGAHGLAVSRDASSLYVSNRRAGSISVIDFATRRVVRTWRVGGSPDMLQVSPDGTQLWASNRYNGTVSVIDTRTGVTRVIRVGGSPHGLCYFPQPGRHSLGHNGVYR